MNSAMHALQAAAVSALAAHPVLADALTGIYAGPPPRALFPYVAINDEGRPHPVHRK